MTGQQLIETAELSVAGHAYIRCRDPNWASPQAYIRLSVLLHNGQRTLGPWAHLFDRVTQEAIGEPTPQATLTFMPPFNREAFFSQEYDPWAGDLDHEDEPTLTDALEEQPYRQEG